MRIFNLFQIIMLLVLVQLAMGIKAPIIGGEEENEEEADEGPVEEDSEEGGFADFFEKLGL